MPEAYRIPAAALLPLLVFAYGCGSAGPEIVPVSGTVTVRGKPEKNLVVSFLPVAQGEEAAGVRSTGITDENGRYSLQTTGEDSTDGAVVGPHEVLIRARTFLGPGDVVDPDKSSTVKLPPNATDGSLTIEVPSEGLDSADFSL